MNFDNLEPTAADERAAEQCARTLNDNPNGEPMPNYQRNPVPLELGEFDDTKFMESLKKKPDLPNFRN